MRGAARRRGASAASTSCQLLPAAARMPLPPASRPAGVAIPPQHALVGVVVLDRATHGDDQVEHDARQRHVLRPAEAAGGAQQQQRAAQHAVQRRLAHARLRGAALDAVRGVDDGPGGHAARQRPRHHLQPDLQHRQPGVDLRGRQGGQGRGWPGRCDRARAPTAAAAPSGSKAPAAPCRRGQPQARVCTPPGPGAAP